MVGLAFVIKLGIIFKLYTGGLLMYANLMLCYLEINNIFLDCAICRTISWTIPIVGSFDEIVHDIH